jgi:LPS-assembly lipoprotein
MWWPRMRRPGPRRPGFALLALLALTAPLDGCGWQPLYGRNQDTSVGGNAGPRLAQVHIAPIADRVGQQLYNNLRDRMNPQGVPADPRYDLIITLSQVSAAQIISQQQTTTRVDLTFTATYNLYLRANPGVSIFHATSRATTAYDIPTDPYSAVVSSDDAKRRGAQSLSDDISNRVASYLASQPQQQQQSP